MKGVVFTVFLELVEKEFGDEILDKLVSNNKLESEGIYTSIGTYNYQELMIMVKQLSDSTSIPVPGLVKTFGKYLLGTFVASYPHFFKRCDHVFDFFESINSYIHVEVKKLYPDAELPHFETKRINDHHLNMRYSSSRQLSSLAYGLIEASLEHYNESFSIEISEPLDNSKDVIFSITLE